MAKLPTRDQLGGLPSARTGTPIATFDASAIGRGAASLGRAISGASADLGQIAEQEQRKQNVLDVARAEAYKTQGFIDIQNEFAQDTDYATFSERAPKRTGEVLNSAKDVIRDDYARELWATTSLSDAARLNDNISDAALAKQQAAQKVALDDALEMHRQIYVDPQTSEDQKSRSRSRIETDILNAERSGLLTSDEAQAARIKYVEDADFSRGKLAVEQDPDIIGSNAAIRNVVDRIIGAESGGNPAAKNPGSSAEGLGQFIDSTWLGMVRKYRPDLAEGKPDAELLELKTDPALSREMTLRYTQENAATLEASGNAVTPGNLYLAHFIGPGGAKSVLSKGDDTQLADVLSPSVIDANSFLQGKTVGWLKNWSDKKAGGSGTPDWYARLSPEQRATVDAQAANYRTKRATEAAAQLKAQRTETNDNYRLRIATFDPSLTASDILNDPVLDNGAKATLINSLNEKFDDVMKTGQAIQAFQNGTFSVDPYDAKAKGLVDNVYGEFLKSVPEQQMQGLAEELVSQTGVVPKQVQNSIRRGLSSTNVSDVAIAANSAYRLYQVDPAALERREGGASITEAALTYDHMVSDLGFTGDEAAKRMIDMRDPAKRREREALLDTKSIKDHLKKVDDGDVASIFDPGLLSFAPDVGETDAARAAIVADYKDVLTESIVDAAGDMDLAEKLAADRFSRIYGTSELALSGPGVVTKYPPEVVYPPDRSGSHEYIKTQAVESLRGEGVEFDGDLFLQPVPPSATDTGTAGDIKAGRPPRYMVYYEKDGVLQQYTLPFYAIPNFEVDLTENANQMIRNRALEEERRKFLESGDLSWKGVSDMLDAVRMRPEMNGRLGAGGQSGGGF